MSDHPYSTNTEGTYENFIAVCLVCRHRNVFNRATDLCTFDRSRSRPLLARTRPAETTSTSTEIESTRLTKHCSPTVTIC
jgi:hypothetical protein